MCVNNIIVSDYPQQRDSLRYGHCLCINCNDYSNTLHLSLCTEVPILNVRYCLVKGFNSQVHTFPVEHNGSLWCVILTQLLYF